MANSYTINYDDERFQQVDAEKQDRLNEINNTYNNMINQSDAFYQNQIDAARDYAATQQDLQQQQTDLAIEEINQQKDKAEQSYLKEQRGAYTDWQKQSNQYGVNAERMAANGMRSTGYSESSQVSMYNAYQNRVAQARDTYNTAVLNYDNSIKEARLANNSKLAEIAYNALQTELELSLNGFQYKNNLLTNQIQMQNQINSEYYTRWQNVLQQMNTENALQEQIRQYNEKMAYQKARDKVADKQWKMEYDLAKKAARTSGGSSGGSSSKSGTATLTNGSISGGTTTSSTGGLSLQGAINATNNAISAVSGVSLSNSKARELYNNATSGKYTYNQIKTALNNAVNQKVITSKDRDNILKSYK